MTGASGGEATAGAAARGAAAPGAGSGAAAAGFGSLVSLSSPLRLPNTTCHSSGAYLLPQLARSGATASRPSASWFRCGRSAAARSAGTSRWCDGRRRFPRSSGRCWRPSRTSADRRGSWRSAGFRSPWRIRRR